MITLKLQKQPDAQEKVPDILQAIRSRFTSGRPRKPGVPADVLGPMFAVTTASNERDRIADFLRDRFTNAEDFFIDVAVVTARLGGADSDRGRTHRVPEDLEKIIALADKLIKIPNLLYAGMLVQVTNRKTGRAVRYQRPFVISPEASEILALAALQQRFKRETN